MKIRNTLASIVLIGAIAAGLSSKTASATESVYWTELGGSIRQQNTNQTNSTKLIYSVDRPRGIDLDTFNGDIYWTNDITGTIQRGNMNGTRGIETLVSGVGNMVYDVDLDTRNKEMYWTQGNAIMKANLNGSNVEVVKSGLGYAIDIDLDPFHNKMYVVDFSPGKILCANMDGSGDWETLVSGLNGPTDITIDPVNHYMYYCLPYDGEIVRANLDGNQRQIVSDRSVSWQPNGVALDIPNGKMYFSDVLNDRVLRANLDGSNPELFYQGVGDVSPMKLATTSPIPEPCTLFMIGLGGLYLIRNNKKNKSSCILQKD